MGQFSVKFPINDVKALEGMLADYKKFHRLSSKAEAMEKLSDYLGYQSFDEIAGILSSGSVVAKEGPLALFRPRAIWIPGDGAPRAGDAVMGKSLPDLPAPGAVILFGGHAARDAMQDVFDVLRKGSSDDLFVVVVRSDEQAKDIERWLAATAHLFETTAKGNVLTVVAGGLGESWETGIEMTTELMQRSPDSTVNLILTSVWEVASAELEDSTVRRSYCAAATINHARVTGSAEKSPSGTFRCLKSLTRAPGKFRLLMMSVSYEDLYSGGRTIKGGTAIAFAASHIWHDLGEEGVKVTKGRDGGP